VTLAQSLGRVVLRKIKTVRTVRQISGSEFQTVGPAIKKARWAFVQMLSVWYDKLMSVCRTPTKLRGNSS